MAEITVIPIRPPRDESAVEFARDLLGRVERGEVSFVAVVCLTPDGSVVDGWTRGDGLRPFTVLGAIDVMRERFMRREVEF